MSPVKFLFTFLFISIILWLLFISASKFVAWTLSRIMKASVAFKVSGWKCLRDVTIKFEKGAVESVCVGEIRFSLRQSLVKLGVGFMSRDPKLQLLISDIEIVTRASNKDAKKPESKKSRKSRSNHPGRGKWMVVANMARFLSISVTDLVVRTPKATVEVKDLGVEISKDGGTKPSILVKLQLVPVIVHVGEPRISFDQTSSFSNGESFTAGQTCFSMIERTSAPFFCEEFHLSSEFGHDREAGIVVKNVDISIGEISLNLNEELIPGKKSSDTQFDESSIEHTIVKKQENKKSPLLAVTKYTSFIPEKVCLSLPKLNVRFVHKEHYIVMENNIMGIKLKGDKSRCVEDIGESTRLDLQLDFSEIHLLKEAENSMVDILKLAVISSVYIPLQPTSPIRSEIDVKLGGTQCNLFMERLKPLMKLSSSKKKKIVLRDENANPVTVQSSGSKAIMWTCTVSAPEMTIVLFNLSGLPIYHGCSQSSHVFANNISTTGTAVHLELGEVNLHMADEYQESLRESLFGVETNTGSLLHIAKITLDWGKKDRESHSPQDDSCKFILVLSVDVTGMGVNLTFKRVQSLISTAFLFKALLKTSSPSLKTSPQSRARRSTKPSGKGIRLVKLNLERCSVNLCSEIGLENEVIDDPKRVNYGSQGGKVTFSVLADGTPRTAQIASTVPDANKMVKCSVGLDIFHFSLCLNKDKQSTQLELERARSVYQEFLEDNSICTKVTLVDMQNAKFVRRAGGLKEIAVCSLFSATDITVRWEPDVHLSLVDLGLRLKLLFDKQKRQAQEDKLMKGIYGNTKEDSVGSLESEKSKKKKESLFAIDVEMFTVTAEAGDGVEAMIQVQSIFSENARIGVLLEGLMLSFNSATVFKSGRMQISRIPHAPVTTALKDSNAKWDWVIQAFDIHIIMPYRLQLRALDDSIEEMLRALKLVTNAKKKAIFPFKEDGAKPKKPGSGSSKIGRVKLYIRKLTADIEEEPVQGWLDQHYRLMKNEARELAVRLSLLESVTTKGSQSATAADMDDSVHEVGGEEIDLQDASSVEKLKEEIYKQSFRSYYRACKSLVTTQGSGACFHDKFQSGFKLSTSRTSLFSITATELDVSLSAIEGGEAGMIDFVQKLDPVALEYKIPFSRLYGSNINLQTGSLVIQLRDYTYPLLAGTSGKCEGRIVLAQQATPFQPQMLHDVYIGRWRKVQMYRSVSGTTPPMKTYLDLPLLFQKGEISYGVGFEPCFTDLSYAFTVALRRANLCVRNPNASNITPPKKEKSLPWWDEMRNYIHGKTTLCFSESTFNVLATTDPYEKSDKLQITSGYMELRHSDGLIHVSAKDFKMFTSSLENLLRNSSIKPPAGTCGAFLVAPSFTLDVTMDWECESGKPLNHFLFALPSEGVAREKIYDPFRSTSLSLRWNFSLRPLPSSNGYVAFDAALHDLSRLDNDSISSPTLNVGPHDFAWLLKFWNLNYIPPHKLRYFSRWPRFGVPRVARSGNLSLDKVMTEFMFRIDSTPTCLRHMSLDDNDPAKGLTFKMTKLKFEMCYSRGKQKYTFDSKRDILDLVYQGLDLHMPKVFLNKDDCTSVIKVVQMTRKSSKSSSTDRVVNENSGNAKGTTERHRDDGFLLSSDYFTIRRQSPKADPARLLAWQEAGRKNLEMTYVRSEFENGSESDEQARSDPSEDDGYNVVIADNCRRIFVYGLKLLWTIENRNAVWSWVGELSKAFAPSKPSPSRQYAQRKLLEDNQVQNKNESQEDVSKNASGASFSKQKEASGSDPSLRSSTKAESQSFGSIDKHGFDDSDEEGTRRFMVNVIEPQFNLHSEDANGRFLLAAVSGRVLARSFHAVLNVGIEMIKQALGSGDVNNPELTWNRMELSVMLERVQAHVAPTDVDPGAGLQWLPKIRRSSPKVKRTGALLERVFMPCDMYFRYTRHKGGTTDLKVKPLKELAFNSQNITATMTSRQFQVMLDVLTNLLFARLPKSRRSSLPKCAEDDEDIEEEADEVVPDGVEEVEIERVNLEQKERARNLLFDDIRKLSLLADASGDLSSEKEGNLWMITCGRSTLVQRLRKEMVNVQKSRKMAAAALRMAMQKAAQLRLMEKEKNKSPSCAMRISLQINKVVWGMLVDGKSFAEAEINDMIYDFDRDYKDVGLARFTTKYFVVRNCLPNAKSDMLLSAWNPPPEWGKKVMLRVDAKQGAPKDGNSPIELFQVDIYPLKIHLTETMYRMMWDYFFPEEEQDSQRRQEVWKVSTTAGLRRAKKGSVVNEASASTSHSTKDTDGSSRSSACAPLPLTNHADSVHGSKMANAKTTVPELGRTSSFERTCEDSVAESVTNELMLQLQSSSFLPSKNEPIGSLDQPDDSIIKGKSKTAKTGRSSQEDKKLGKPTDEKRSRPRVMREFHNIKISQVELLVTYEGSRFAVSDLRLLMDTFHRVDFTGTWRCLFSRVKKHIIWGVLKSVTGMQGKKFKDKLHGQSKETTLSGIHTTDLNLSDSDGGPSGKAEQVPITWPKRPPEGAGDGFVTSIRGLFHSQRRKAKAFVLRTMRGEGENDQQIPGDWSESDTEEYSPFARQLTITKARKLIRRHTKKFHRSKKGISSQQRDSSLPSSPVESTPYESNSSSGSDPYEDFLEYKAAQEKSLPLPLP